MRRRRELSLLGILIGSAVVLVAGLTPAWLGAAQAWVLSASALMTAGCGVALWWGTNASSASAAGIAEAERAEIDRLRTETLAVLEDRARRVGERERDLTQRLVRFQEFLEYPGDDPHLTQSPAELQQLTEQDRAVQELLDAEAERVYEKIRGNGYSRDGVVDLAAIRADAEDLILRIARIYRPDSQQPLLETSFEQLARAASRICLHTLVLLEQLPINVQQYTISELYRYLRQATSAWETFRKASPWMRHLSRGVYAGRLLSTTNPVALGAWWLASEVGRRGASRMIESWVDRQAVAVLHDLVTVMGVEVASVYGQGFRHRDAAWVEGCELVELLHRFPPSREALREALNRITRLPLQNEYDRIYLYRCLATQRSPGYRLADSSLLARSQREGIAAGLEQFFERCVHGTSQDSVDAWRAELEERLDLRLRLRTKSAESPRSTDQLRHAALASLHDFATGIIGLSSEDATTAIRSTALGRTATAEDLQKLRASAAASASGTAFHPPDLDPADPLTTAWLEDLAGLTARHAVAEDHVLEVVRQAGAWFRRPQAEINRLIDEQCLACLRETADEGGVHSGLTGDDARAILAARHLGERLRFTYPNVARCVGDESDPLPGAWLAGFHNADRHTLRTVLLQITNGVAEELWNHTGPLRIERRRSLLLDGAEIAEGRWSEAAGGASAPGTLVVAGSLRGGRFSTYFRPLLANAAAD